ncbi:MAG: hypothetical protein QG635_2013 [Bacteroidota bacterium]|nr:hypothetical protein [Bacteroidota bacterium]
MFDTIQFENEADWLAERSQGIGGSEIGAILGVDEYKSKLDLYLEKKGLVERKYSDDELDNFDRGHWFEVPLLDYLAKQENIYIEHNTALYISKEDPILRCTPDGINDDIIVEAKSTRLFVNEPLEKWLFQGNWNCGITGRNTLYIVWIDASMKRRYEIYPFNSELFEYMKSEAIAFWKTHIEQDIPPEPTSPSDVLKLYQKHYPGKVYDLSLEEYDSFNSLCDIKEEIKKLDELEAKYKGELQMLMNDAEILMYSGNVVATWKASETNRFDTTAFKKAYPDLYKQFTNAQNSRRFLIK